MLMSARTQTTPARRRHWSFVACLSDYLQLAGCSLPMTGGAATVSTNTPSASAAISRRFMEFSL